MSEKNFTEKVVSVQSELKAPKGQFNKFGNYKYRSLEDINEALKPLLAREQLQLTVSDDLVLIGERYYVKATATISDSEGNYVEAHGYARESQTKKGMDDSQITGTASSYARKYAMNGLFLIDDTKDADTDEYAKQTKNSSNRSESQPPKNKSVLTDSQKQTAVSKMTEFAKQQNMKLEQAVNKLFPYLKLEPDLAKLTPDGFGILMNYLNKKMGGQ
ncbi:ERF family protein [Enterococcus mundtii]|uniref:ERF family protein n=1 Tax=Enterococcus mundtii TaxID=53346 RepID=UPI001929BF6C|nr:ERF family protein [Enterococcus mundtii]